MKNLNSKLFQKKLNTKNMNTICGGAQILGHQEVTQTNNECGDVQTTSYDDFCIVIDICTITYHCA